MAKGYPDFEGDKSGLYLKPEWAAYEGEDKTFTLVAANKASGAWIFLAYDVPLGKTLYISQCTFYSWAFLAADRDNNQMCRFDIQRLLPGAAFYSRMGGNGGGQAAYTKPLVFEAEERAYFTITNVANHSSNIGFCAVGYEI